MNYSNISTLAIDLAKNVFQLHGENKLGKKVYSRRITRKKFAEEVIKMPEKCLIKSCGIMSVSE